MGVLIPSVMALRETAMTAPLDQQGEPRAANGRPYWFLIGSRKNRGIATPVLRHWFAMTWVFRQHPQNGTKSTSVWIFKNNKEFLKVTDIDKPVTHCYTNCTRTASTVREALIKSARADSERFFSSRRLQKRRNTLCTRKGYAASVSQSALATAALYFPVLKPHG